MSTCGRRRAKKGPKSKLALVLLSFRNQNEHMRSTKGQKGAKVQIGEHPVLFCRCSWAVEQVMQGAGKIHPNGAAPPQQLEACGTKTRSVTFLGCPKDCGGQFWPTHHYPLACPCGGMFNSNGSLRPEIAPHLLLGVMWRYRATRREVGF